MKFGIAVLITVVVLAGCSKEGIPPAPTAPSSPVAPAPPAPPPSTTGSALLWVMVLPDDGSGQCIEGATIQIVGALGAGEPIPQKTPCDVWSSDGGLLLKNLTPGTEVMLRGAATGYTPREMSFLPSDPASYQAVFIELAKAR